MDAVVIQASGPPAQSLAYRSEPVPAVLDGSAGIKQVLLPAGGGAQGG
jgi:hypothetical protein